MGVRNASETKALKKNRKMSGFEEKKIMQIGDVALTILK